MLLLARITVVPPWLFRACRGAALPPPQANERARLFRRAGMDDHRVVNQRSTAGGCGCACGRSAVLLFVPASSEWLR